MPQRPHKRPPEPPRPGKMAPDQMDITRDQLMAASIGNVDWLQLCIETAGSQIKEDHNGFTALHTAALHGQLQCLKLLTEHYNMDLNSSSRSGWRALHLVLNQKNVKSAKECLQYLLQHGADVNIQSESKATPLHQAAREGLQECLAILVEKGADVHAKDSDGNQPIDLCKVWCHRTCARYLQNAMWKKEKAEIDVELKKMEDLKRNILEREQVYLVKRLNCHTQLRDHLESEEPPTKSDHIFCRAKTSSGSGVAPQFSRKVDDQGRIRQLPASSEKVEKDAKRETMVCRKQGVTTGLDDTKETREHSSCGARLESHCSGWNPSYNPTMPPITDIYRMPTLRLGTHPEDVTKSDLSSVVTLERDKQGKPQIRSVYGEIFPVLHHLPYEIVQRSLFPETAPKERIRTSHEFKARHVFDVPKKQPATEGGKPVSEISFHLRRNLDSKLKRDKISHLQAGN